MAVRPTASNPAESKPLPKVGNELLCIEAVDDSLSVRSERADGADTRRHFDIVVNGLRIIGRKDDLGPRKLGETHSRPICATLAGIIRARPSAAVVDQTVLQIVVERQPWLPVMPRNARSEGLPAVLKSANPRQIAADPSGKMRHVNPQRRKLIQSTAVDQPHCCDTEREFTSEHP